MIRRTTYAVFLALAIASASVTAAVGDSSLHAVAYGLSVLLGVVAYFLATKRLVDEAIGTTLLGVLGGLVFSELVLTAVNIYILGTPVDLAAWQMWTFLLLPWAYVLTLLLTGYFCTGIVDMMR